MITSVESRAGHIHTVRDSTLLSHRCARARVCVRVRVCFGVSKA